MYPSVHAWVDSYPNKKICTYQGIVLVKLIKSSFSCHFPLNARNWIYFRPTFLAVNV